MKLKINWRKVSAVLFILVVALSLLLFFALREKPSQYTHVYLGELQDNNAPADKNSLQFEETLAPFLPESIHQVDYALLQLLTRQHLRVPELVAESSGLTDALGQQYTYKTLQIYAGEEAASFIRKLHDSIIAWAEKASLVRDEKDGPAHDGQEIWHVFINNVKTHTLIILPEHFPHESESQPKAVPALSPKMAVVIDDLGESMPQLQRLLHLNYPVTCAVWPRSTYAAATAAAAFDAGKEVIVHQPMEPVGYPQVNPGEGALLNHMTDAEIREYLSKNFKLVPYASGLNNHMGSSVTQNARIMKALAAELKERNLIALDSMTHSKSIFYRVSLSTGVTTYQRNIFLDVEQDKAKILRQLRKAEHIALISGQVVAIGHPYAATLEALEEWQHIRNVKIQIVRLRDLTPLSRP